MPIHTQIFPLAIRTEMIGAVSVTTKNINQKNSIIYVVFILFYFLSVFLCRWKSSLVGGTSNEIRVDPGVWKPGKSQEHIMNYLTSHANKVSVNYLLL